MMNAVLRMQKLAWRGHRYIAKEDAIAEILRYKGQRREDEEQVDRIKSAQP